ncbi:phosphoenolpyruvate phosphomutase-domain-containing protein [Chaetomium strumarium]|uniref:Phosphoenolpyruvate phosphomutase-domain-containing protein n=1 Tax=Chaetomium strumarium TaxID=1170767 RepID=A0AAJ0GMM3_9PEZI|nr:phosphoenolpyruvate phosphomutase-domain-containing protein [Chaetomium strumarium]
MSQRSLLYSSQTQNPRLICLSEPSKSPSSTPITILPFEVQTPPLPPTMTTPTLPTLAARAKAFKALHVPGTPLVLANVHDATSARIVASLPQCRALASASYALAKTIGIEDEQLTLDQNLRLLAPIAAVAHEFGLPFTVDIQDGYGDRLAETVRRVIVELGAVGVNLEDSHHEDGRMVGEEEAVERVKRALEVAREVGVPDFVVNARSDSFLVGGELDESIRRGKRYLEAGATTVFVFWPLDKDVREEDLKRVVDALEGRVNLNPRKASQVQSKALTSADLARLGAARVSVGPLLYRVAAQALTAAANEVFGV